MSRTAHSDTPLKTPHDDVSTPAKWTVKPATMNNQIHSNSLHSAAAQPGDAYVDSQNVKQSPEKHKHTANVDESEPKMPQTPIVGPRIMRISKRKGIPAGQSADVQSTGIKMNIANSDDDRCSSRSSSPDPTPSRKKAKRTSGCERKWRLAPTEAEHNLLVANIHRAIEAEERAAMAKPRRFTKHKVPVRPKPATVSADQVTVAAAE